MSTSVGIVALPEVALAQQMYSCGGGVALGSLVCRGDVGVVPAHPHLVKAWSATGGATGGAVGRPAGGLA